MGEWGDTGARRGEWRVCRLEPCTWQSFGTRAGSSTPHAFEARKLLLKLSTDPAVVAILKNQNPNPNPNRNRNRNPNPNLAVAVRERHE